MALASELGIKAQLWYLQGKSSRKLVDFSAPQFPVCGLGQRWDVCVRNDPTGPKDYAARIGPRMPRSVLPVTGIPGLEGGWPLPRQERRAAA